MEDMTTASHSSDHTVFGRRSAMLYQQQPIQRPRVCALTGNRCCAGIRASRRSCHMRYVSGTGLFVLVVLISAVRVHAQCAPSTPDAAIPSIVVSGKSPVTAGYLELLLPTLGYGYAGNWSRGIPSALVRITGLGLAFNASNTTGRARTEALGLAIFGAGAIWAVIDASRTASRENARRREAVLGGTVMPTLGLGPTGTGVGLHVSIGL